MGVGCGGRDGSGGGGWRDYRDDPAIHPRSKQNPVFPPQTLANSLLMRRAK